MNHIIVFLNVNRFLVNFLIDNILTISFELKRFQNGKKDEENYG